MTFSEQASGSGLAPALALFVEMLERRLKLGVFTNEDAVRYTFFVALLHAPNLCPEDIVLEHDHSAIARAKIDTWIPFFNGRSYAIEFNQVRSPHSEREERTAHTKGRAHNQGHVSPGEDRHHFRG